MAATPPTRTNGKGKLLRTGLTLLIAVLTIVTVFSHAKTLSPAEVLGALGQASPFWLMATILCMLGFIVFEGLALLCILRSLGCPRGFLRGMLYSASDQYFSAITPSATGGQPASAFFMSSDRVPGAVITATLLLNLVMYTAATAIIGIACLLVRPGLFMRFDSLSKVFIIFSTATMAVLSLLLVGLLVKGDVLNGIGRKLIRFLNKVHLLRNPDHWAERLDRLVGDYKDCVQAISGKNLLLFAVFLLNLAQRIAQISVTLTLFHALGGGFEVQGLDLWTVQAFSQVGSNCIPIPGGMGAADYLMLDGFQLLFSRDFAYQLQILSRGISFYVCTLISGLIVLLGSLSNRQGERRGETKR
ncbi:MAG: lysylphosphatidylglycerol synthase transmembrane domain-containing protein [Actinomycetota bacterium]|nr:lysylphosphatidylglycerol synthase transmembrane domain-containing protein [Actinomycetota bacterium]